VSVWRPLPFLKCAPRPMFWPPVLLQPQTAERRGRPGPANRRGAGLDPHGGSVAPAGLLLAQGQNGQEGPGRGLPREGLRAVRRRAAIQARPRPVALSRAWRAGAVNVSLRGGRPGSVAQGVSPRECRFGACSGRLRTAFSVAMDFAMELARHLPRAGRPRLSAIWSCDRDACDCSASHTGGPIYCPGRLNAGGGRACEVSRARLGRRSKPQGRQPPILLRTLAAGSPSRVSTP
jgi:hypothetical protein